MRSGWAFVLLAASAVTMPAMARDAFQVSRPLVGCTDPQAALALANGSAASAPGGAAAVRARGGCFSLSPSVRLDLIERNGSVALVRRDPPRIGVPPLYVPAGEVRHAPPPKPKAPPAPKPETPAPVAAQSAAPSTASTPAPAATEGDNRAPPVLSAPIAPPAASNPSAPSAGGSAASEPGTGGAAGTASAPATTEATPPAPTATAPTATAPASPPAAPPAGSAPAADGTGNAAGTAPATGEASAAAAGAPPPPPPPTFGTETTGGAGTAGAPAATASGAAAQPAASAPVPVQTPAQTPAQTSASTPAPASEIHGWIVALIILLLLAGFVAAAVVVAGRRRHFSHVEEDWPPHEDRPRGDALAPAGRVAVPDAVTFRKRCAASLEEAGWTTHLNFNAEDSAPDIVARRDGVLLAMRCRPARHEVVSEMVDEAAVMGARQKAQVVVLASNAPFSRKARDEASRQRVHLLRDSELAGFIG